jgi:addiction module HigA family antidote
MIELQARYSAGEFLKTMVLEERGLTQKWLADKFECSERKISEICNNKRAISPMFAIELEKAFGIRVTMQAKWDLQNARKKVA